MAKEKNKIIGRQTEMDRLIRTLQLQRNLLIEGPVGVGKTFLVVEALKQLKKNYERIDGDTRYTEQKLTGWFDPPLVLKKGYVAEAFIDGPLITAMKGGEALFINELNRMPESVQNILLPAMDERRVIIPKLGEVVAKPGFLVIGTQNPREFTATHALSEALMDRFEMLSLAYQNRDEELTILSSLSEAKVRANERERVLDLVRSTREHPAIKRGASIRAAIAITDLISGGLEFSTAVKMALPSRIELVSSEENIDALIENLLTLNPLGLQKKK